ncbi:CCA tRNA nucleotidyltransferase [Tabrizicola sp. J26]|uniref:CCA tRNA nucleotidyltransferase n=1 Tax=Alitabrizicola rongguiensis TaxID=2909234 RepID=UPI001F33CDAF|nr:CCA tRNA nucleotidyltransferase [Tabrizicola rongguiensis]MCF1708176.1 CCA tRNA nucleotidyltransferase [Tabrizicola rongguiensis]
MRITGDWLERPETQAVCRALTDAGYRALFVGGCVRNALLGQPVADVDLSTDAHPETVSTLAQKAGLKPVPTGIAHGTITVVSGGIPHEVTTFRHDVETFGRHARVAFAKTVEDDAARRDFTMNALYATPEGKVVDPLGGLADLEARLVRFVGDPSERIAEDYLRILRFFRFHALYGDPARGLDADGLSACAAGAGGLEALSKERIGHEMRRLLAAPDPSPSVAAMAQAGILGLILPGADPRSLPVLVHLEGDMPADWIRRLACLGGEDPSEHLRLSRAETERLGRIRAAALAEAVPAVVGYRLGSTEGADAVLLHAAFLSQDLPANWRGEIARGAAARFPVKAADLMPELAGPALGARLSELEARWIGSDFRLSRADLLG